MSDRRPAEASLRASEARFRALADATATAFWTVENSDEPHDAMRTRWPYLTDLSAAELAAEWLAAVHPDDREPGNAIWQAGLAAGEPFEFEQRVRQRDGSWRHFLVRTVPVRNADGTIREWVGADIDVTERKSAEFALRRSEERYRTLFESVDQGFCIIEIIEDESGRPIDYRFEEVNPTFAVHTGLTDAVGKTARQLVPDLEDHWIETYGQVARTGARQRFEQGSSAMGRWFEVEAVRIGDEKSRRVALLFSDVTDRKQHEDRLRLGIDVAGFAVLEVDYVAGVIHLTAEAARLYGVGDAAATLPREQIHAAFHPDDRDELLRRIAAKTKSPTNEPYTTEYRVIWPSGEVRWLSVRKKIIFDHDGAHRRPVRAVMAVLDITARKQAEEDRQALLDALAHDLRNPLTVLKMQAQLLLRQLQRERPIDPDALTERISGFVDLSERMTGLIDDLEEYAHLGLGGGAPDRKTADLLTLARSSIDELQLSGGDHRIRLATDEAELRGHWDPLHVGRVLDNLLSNAVKYSPAGSEITVRLARDGRFALLEVKDRGIGIPQADLPHIFSFRHRGGNVGSVAGSGVGLAGVKQIVERHGGTVSVVSEEGRGATFSVRLPLLPSVRNLATH